MTVTGEQGTQVQVEGPEPQLARTRPTDEALVRRSMEKCGGTPYYLGELETCLGEGLMLPVSALSHEIICPGAAAGQRGGSPASFCPGAGASGCPFPGGGWETGPLGTVGAGGAAVPGDGIPGPADHPASGGTGTAPRADDPFGREAGGRAAGGCPSKKRSNASKSCCPG